MKLVFLSADYVPQHVMLLKQLITQYNVEIISFGICDGYTYIPQNIPSLEIFEKKYYTKEQILEIVLENNPSLLYVAGYFNKDFVWIASKVKKRLKIPVIVGCDTQWRATFKQWLGSFISFIYILPNFTHIWVAGIYQFEWARKLGFKKKQIIFNMYSGDTSLFSSIDILKKETNYPHNFIFVGRFVEEKGLEYLCKAWAKVKVKKDWTLTLIGEGVLKEKLLNYPDILFKGYLTQDLLCNEIAKSGCFVLPSVFEPWAVVIHEFAVAGMPIICSNVCGASAHFIINGYNGFIFESAKIESIVIAFEKIISLSDEKLIEMSYNSRKLGLKITQEISAASLMSTLE